MGQYLSSPVTSKDTVSGNNGSLCYGISAQQGWRKSMEDAHIAQTVGDSGVHIFGVFDGHGGHEVAKFVSKYMVNELENIPDFREGRYKEGLIQVFHRMDSLLRSAEGFKALGKLRDVAEKGQDVEKDDEDAFDVMRRIMALQRIVNNNGEEDCLEKKQGADETEDAFGELGVHVQAGCTAVVALVKDKNVYVANAGDSRAVLCRGNVAVPLSEDHKPSQASERARIVAAGGFVSEIGGITRVNGNLNLSRAIGDLRYKMNSTLLPKEQIITAEPDVQHIQLMNEDTFLLLACDGIWDVLSNQQAVDFVRQRLSQGMSPTDCANELLDACLAKDPREARGVGCDNMTAAIIAFRQNEETPYHFSKGTQTATIDS